VVDELGPLDELGAVRSAEPIGTLCAYLDARDSLKAAARLRLHPNAVNYRIRKITERLDVDSVGAARNTPSPSTRGSTTASPPSTAFSPAARPYGAPPPW
jgi:hypothetical protein